MVQFMEQRGAELRACDRGDAAVQGRIDDPVDAAWTHRRTAFARLRKHGGTGLRRKFDRVGERCKERTDFGLRRRAHVADCIARSAGEMAAVVGIEEKGRDHGMA
ncbi:MAG TPA: hypothetical protein VFT52_04800 [Luteimonas sp.]|nr:hypothetical protein [Luteimonas sp.]